MREFSLDLAAEKIHSGKSREYFGEVISSYYNDNFRSAIVMLYSVALTDLFLKLKALRDVYSDTTATKILNEIEQMQNDNPTSPNWEGKLVELVNDRTKLLKPADHQNLENLRKMRHLCAHPVIIEQHELYRPNRETVRALMRNTLEGLLNKPPMLSKKILNALLEDLEENRRILINDTDLAKFLNAKYFDNLGQLVKEEIFKALWKLVFRVDDEDCNKNREINFRTLKFMMEKWYDVFMPVIGADTAYYSNISQVGIREAVGLVNAFPRIYESLNGQAKVLIENEIKTSADLTVFAWFLTGDIVKHVEFVLGDSFNRQSFDQGDFIQPESVIHLFYALEMHEGKTEAHKLLITFFEKSRSFNEADSYFDELIRPYLYDFDLDAFKLLLNAINTNNQIYNRSAASVDGREVRKVLDSRYQGEVNYNDYLNYKSSIR